MATQRDFSEDMSLLSQLTPTSLSSVIGNPLSSSLQQQVGGKTKMFAPIFK